MGFRLALIGCVSPYDGPWAVAKGNERGLEITGLVDGEAIELDLEAEGALRTQSFDSAGSFPVDDFECNKYRVRKIWRDDVSEPSLTIVRVLLNAF